ALDAPKPTSSIRTMRTLGAPDGGRRGTIGGYLVSGSFASYVVVEIGVTSGIGRTSRLRRSLGVLISSHAPLYSWRTSLRPARGFCPEGFLWSIRPWPNQPWRDWPTHKPSCNERERRDLTKRNPHERVFRCEDSGWKMGLGRVELPTSRLSGPKRHFKSPAPCR